MTQNERLKELRKSLGLTLEKFGNSLGLKKNTLSAIETGRNSLTDANIKSICREFHVNESWLRDGEGEMFVESDDDFYNRIDQIMSGEDEARKNLFKLMLTLSDKDIAALSDILEKVILFSQEQEKQDDLSELYNEVPQTPEELEKLYPPIDLDPLSP